MRKAVFFKVLEKYCPKLFATQMFGWYRILPETSPGPLEVFSNIVRAGQQQFFRGRAGWSRAVLTMLTGGAGLGSLFLRGRSGAGKVGACNCIGILVLQV